MWSKRFAVWVASGLLWTGVGRADLPPGVNPLQVFQLGVDASQKLVAAGEKDKARFVLLGITSIIQRAQGQLPGDLLPRFEKCMNACWEPLTEANLPAQAQAFKAAMEEFEPRLVPAAIALDLTTPRDNWSFDQWATYVLKARQSYPGAEAMGVEYAAKAGSPVLHLKFGTSTHSFQVLNYLQRILCADGLWDPILQRDILPRSLRKASEELDRVDIEKHDPWIALTVIDKANQYVGYAKAAAPANDQLKPLEARIAALNKRAQERIGERIASNRFPADTYRGADAAALREQFKALYTRSLPDEKVLRVALRSSDWVETAEAWWEGETLRSGIYRWLDAAVAVAKDDGQCRVFYARFGKAWTGRGDTFADPFFKGTTVSYLMLVQNLP